MNELDRRQMLGFAGAMALAPVAAAAAEAAGSGAPPAAGRGAGGGRAPVAPYDPNAPLGVEIGVIRRLDPELDAIVDDGAPILRISNINGFTEGPCWAPEDGGYLLFSDPPGNRMYKWTEKDGTSIFMAPSGLAGPDPDNIYREPGSNGIQYRDGHIVYGDHGNRAVVRLNLRTRQKTILADRFEGKRLNSPNDIAITKSGVIFFTDPPYGLNGTLNSPQRELDFQGVFRIGLDGQLSVVDKPGGMPNGVAISPDGKLLYVSNTGGQPRSVYDLDINDMASNKRTFPGNADGFKVDAKGNVWGGAIFNPAGKQIGMVQPAPGARGPSNCYFGGGYLYLTMGFAVGRVKVKVGGAS